MKSFVKKILFKNRTPKTFPAVRIKNDQVQEKVLLKKDRIEIDITEKNCIVCHSPFMMAVWMTSDQSLSFIPGFVEASVVNGNQLCARVILSFAQKIQESGNWIVLYRIDHAKCYQLNSVHQFLLYRYFKNKNSILQDKIYSALYSYPRRVISVSYREEGYYNIFPMDFQCFIAERNLYILGLRTTNITIEKVINSKRVVIADTDRALLDTIYFLGNHHSRSPAPAERLPFKTIESEQFGFPIPDFASMYREIEITGNQRLGTHMLLIGKVINTKEIRQGNSSVYHIHFFQSFRSMYIEA